MRHSYTDEQLLKAVIESFSIAQVLKCLNLRPCGGNYSTLKTKIKKLGINMSHFTGRGWNKDKRYEIKKKIQLDDILNGKHPTYQSHKLKLQLLKHGVFDYKCYNCNGTIWLNQPIPLELEHKNGVNDDHRLENLTLICPNCHAQTSTYRGKNSTNISN